MKLRYSTTSPFVRKIVVALIETGLDKSVERVATNPMKKEDVQNSPNPLGKVPCLETDDGMVIYDSPVIIEYLDGLHNGAKLIPASGKPRWDALRRQALGDGVLDNLVLSFVETLRKPERQSLGWIAHNRAGVARALGALETEADALAGPVDIGRITVAIALDFVDMHWPESNWRSSHPKLAEWFAAWQERPAMAASVLKDPRKAA